MRTAALCLMVFIAPIVLAQSQPPAPSARELVQKPDAQPAKDQGGASAQQQQPAPVGPRAVIVAPAQVAQPPAQGQPYEHRHEASTDWWTVGVNAALAVFTGLLFFYTARMAGATKQLAEAGADTAKRQLRAYIGLDVDGLYFQEQVSIDRLRLKMRIRNNGNTPAQQVKIRRWFTPSAPERFEEIDGAALVEGAMVHPRQHFAVFLDSPLTSNDPFYVVGYVEYVDIYERTWRTRFAWEHRGDGWFMPHREYNDEQGPK